MNEAPSESRRRVLLKISGEALGGTGGLGLDPDSFMRVAGEVASVREGEIAIVVGAGNIARGRDLDLPGMHRCQADEIGMAATHVNAMTLAAAIRSSGRAASVHSGLPASPSISAFSASRVRSLLSNGEVAVLSGGTGNPFFTTDSCAALRALELDCDLFLKGTRVDGLYSADPEIDPDAVRIERASFAEVLRDGLQVMDSTAFTLCSNNGLPVTIFDMTEPGKIALALLGSDIGSRIVP